MKGRRKKEKEKEEQFIRCKEKCVCEESVCIVINLQECSSCHNILRSSCGKSGCKKDGMKPKMIFPAAALLPKKGRELGRKVKAMYNDTDSDRDQSEYATDEDVNGSDEMMESDTDNENVDPKEHATQLLSTTWKNLIPPVSEEDIIGRWFGVAYASKR